MAGKNDKWAFYQDAAGEWFWRRTSSRGIVVSYAEEGYRSLQDCVDSARVYGYLE